MKVYGICRLVKEPEVREFEKGKVVKLRLASDEGYGERKRTSFFDADYFVSQEAKITEYLSKGRQVFIEGELRQDEWEKDGKKFSKLFVVVRDLKLIGGNGNSSSSTSESSPSSVEVEEDFEF